MLPGAGKWQVFAISQARSGCWLMLSGISWVPLWASFSPCVSEESKLKAAQAPISSLVLTSTGLLPETPWAEYSLGKQSQLGSVYTSAICDLCRRQLCLHTPPCQVPGSVLIDPGKGLTVRRAEPWCWRQNALPRPDTG